ncbi:unnamed protein product [Rotaria sordida]|uniref:Mediator of RNA polymerase II transcription subunit 13 n=1 Tax=Rotaria sordida TaxID=392033 RepID=A0A814FQF0_9BILA|nr:unnamed protein product [Rotaria sordida]
MNTPCSLEHCHTNLFALQSLNDMKWKCFRRTINYRLETNQVGRIDNYKDPVLIAYWNALHADILCSWRRVSTDDGQKTERELWLFGINEDLPSDLPNLRPINHSHGSWNESAMSYDCRSMLFKALHNMIEKYLLAKGFARLNKWFVLPINDHSDVKVPNYSFNFNFFLHGDNKVCASVDVQRHEHVFNLTSKDLERTSPSNVILAPYGINGMLIGHVSREIDMNICRESWEKSYPIRHLDGLPDFVEVTTGNARMFYPTCYVYKIGSNDESTTNNENTSTNKKSNTSITKKPKSTATTTTTTTTTSINTSLDITSNKNKIDNSFIKKFANNLLVATQRNSCIDLEKKQDNQQNDICLTINDPVNHHLCQCNQTLSINTRSSPFIPFHRRPRTTSPITSDSSIRNKIDTIKTENSSSESIENHDTLIESTSSSIVTTNTQLTTNEKPADWTASTPNSVGITGPPSVLASITNQNSTTINSPAPNPISTRGIKRSAAKALDETYIEDDESEQQKQTYDFYRTDSFLQLPLKRFRADDQLNLNEFESTITTCEHVYQHGQPTPPSPSQISFRSNLDFDDNEDLTSRTNYLLSTSNNTRSSNQSSFFLTDGPSMADLETIIDSQYTIENKNSNTHSHNISDNNIKSPSRKENILPPPPPIPILHEMEQIYNTPPGSSSSEKLQALHSPYGIIIDTSIHVANTFDALNHFSQESILAPFESNSIAEQSSYYPLNKFSLKKFHKRYEPSKSLSITTSTYHKNFRNWKHTIPINDISSSPFNNNQQILRQQTTPRSMPTPIPNIYSPMRSNDLQSSPYPNRSISSVQTINSPISGIIPSIIPEIDSFIFNILLTDSILNIYRDINFDSCVLCACNSNDLSIHGMDSIIYLEKPHDNIKSIHSHMYTHQQSPYQHSTIYSQQQQQQQQQSISSTNNSCSCGFSAVVNLRLGYSSGLFYEDEIEITGIKADIKYRQLNDNLSINLLELIEKKQSISSPFDYFNNQNLQKQNTQDILQKTLKEPFYQYENWACRLALDQARNNGNGLIVDDIDKHHWLHQWSYLTSPLDSDQQLITMLRSLQPLLVEALKKRNVNGLWSTIDGPLTWKSFHQLLYVQNQHAHLEEQISGPQPIPYILAGLDREWIMLAPYGLKFWDKLCLEPYSKRKDIGYICIVPDNDYICTMTKIYFRELSSHYELCRLGSHRPLLKAFSDQGLLRISSQQCNDSSQLPNVDSWFTDHETTHPLGSRLKLYAQIFKDKLLNILTTQSFDNTLSDDSTSRRDVFRSPNDISSSSSSSFDHYSTNNDLIINTGVAANSIYTTGSPASDALNTSSNNLSPSSTNGTIVNGQQVDPIDLQAFESYYHGRSLNDDQLFLVIYIIDTFRYELMGSSNNDNDDIHIDDTIDIYVRKSIFRAYLDLIKDLPEKITLRLNIQIVPFESIVNQQMESDAELRLTRLKRFSFHVYDQLRQTVSHTTRAKSLTGFGPAISEEKMQTKIVMQLYTPAYILSPKSDFRFKPFADITEQTNINGSILFCSYCLSDDQRYLLAACSDDRGELLETCSINIEVPDRHKRKIQHARRIGLQKLWDFIMRIVTGTTMPWRIVIGRLGRLGHGELKNWGVILSKKNLVRCATLIRESCSMCHILRSHDHPVILSACLISMETHPLLTILPESLELGEMRGTQPSNNNTTTMQNSGQVLSDVSVTHILTLPTSASVQHVQAIPRPNDPRQSPIYNEDDLFNSIFEGFDTDPFGPMQSPPPDLEFPPTGVLDINHNGNPNGPMSRLNSLSISQHNYNGNDLYGNSLHNSNIKSNSLLHLDSEVDLNDIPSLHQQPLALGFYVSTIGTLNSLPIWMLQGKSNQRLNNTSSVFKATLHVSVPNAQHSDDMLFAQSHDQKSIHPLDSNYTYVVLRHVLESYNRLSWLLIDAKTNERASCLPIHMETLLKLYHAFIKFV